MPEHQNPYPPPDGPEHPDEAAESGEAAADTPDAAAARPRRSWMPRRRAAQSGGGDASGEAPAAPAPTGQDDDAPADGEADSGGRRWTFRRRSPEAADAGAQDAAGDGPPDAVPGDTADAADEAGEGDAAAPVTGGPGRLRRRRKRLIRDREVAVYHLGGLAFELYRRDLLDEDVLQRRAETIAAIDESVQEIDLRLEQIETDRRERRAQRAGAAPSSVGNCLTCRAPFQADARFCWQCGARIAPADHDEQITAAIGRPT